MTETPTTWRVSGARARARSLRPRGHAFFIPIQLRTPERPSSRRRLSPHAAHNYQVAGPPHCHDVIACLGQQDHLIRTTRPRYIEDDIMTTARLSTGEITEVHERHRDEPSAAHSHKPYCHRAKPVTSDLCTRYRYQCSVLYCRHHQWPIHIVANRDAQRLKWNFD